MSDSRPSVTIRMPAELMERIKAAAAASGRSMNAEIVWQLEYVFGVRQPQMNGDDQERRRAEALTLARAVLAQYGEAPSDEL